MNAPGPQGKMCEVTSRHGKLLVRSSNARLRESPSDVSVIKCGMAMFWAVCWIRFVAQILINY